MLVKFHNGIAFKVRQLPYLFLLIIFLLTLGVEKLIADEANDSYFVSNKYPVDVSFMIADLKYSEERGVKICEIQHGILSTFRGDRMVHGEPGHVFVNLNNHLSQFHEKSWAAFLQFSDPGIREQMAKSINWSTHSSLGSILKDKDFKKKSSMPVYDPNNIHSYHGFLTVKPTNILDYESFLKKYPGIILMGRATHPFWIDKFKMTELFSQDETLASFKPRWKLYKKKYTKTLAKEIIEDLQCDSFVIKPRGAFLGNGVIIVDKDNLDDTLNYILNKSKELFSDPDQSYSYWCFDPFDSLLVEEFIPSDPISVPYFDNKVYQPTMRVGFLLIYNEHKVDIKFLVGYWLLPYYAINEGGTLNEKHKAYCKLPYFCEADPEVLSEVYRQLNIALPLLYKQMLMKE